MANTYSLQYGGRDLVLEKSEDLIALRPEHGALDAAYDAVAAITSGSLTGEQLGRFKLARLLGTPTENDRELDELRRHSAVAVGTHVYHTGADGVPFVPTGTIFLRFMSGTSSVERNSLLQNHGLEILEARGNDDLVVKVTPKAANPVKTAQQLQSSSMVAIAEPDFASRGKLTSLMLPTDALLAEQWHLRNTGFHRGTSVGFLKGADAKVVQAWEAMAGLGSTDIVIAVIDDGFDLEHPDLSAVDRIVAPWDFEFNTAMPRPRGGDWHGTACAGVALAASGAGQVVGVASQSRLMPVRWGVELTDTSVEKWFQHVVANGAWVVSCSWSAAAENYPLSTRKAEAISKCARDGREGKGCVIVFAAGNESRDIDDPASGSVNGFAVHPDVIAVAASNSMDVRSSYSNFGDAVSVCAPSSGAGGWGILTSDVTGQVTSNGVQSPRGYAEGDYDFDFGGTSSACPLVAGVCALVLSVKPDLTSAEVKWVLQKTARRIGQATDYVNDHSKFHGYGCVDAVAAVVAVGA